MAGRSPVAEAERASLAGTLNRGYSETVREGAGRNLAGRSYGPGTRPGIGKASPAAGSLPKSPPAELSSDPVSIAEGTTADRLFRALTAFRKSWPGRGFSWDSRLFCVASSFSTEHENEARAAVGQLFRFQWTARTVRTAPASILEIAEQVGGLRPDQVLVATEPNDGLMAYGLWWPWGDDATISLRVGLAGVSATRYEDDFRELFGALL